MRRDTTLSLAALLLRSTASATASSTPECLKANSQELAERASCGDVGSLNNCFSNKLSLDATTAPEQLTSELSHCFLNAGCTHAESQIEALWTLQLCSSGALPPSDLRRRSGAIPLPRDPAPIPGLTIIAARQATTAPPSPTTAAPAANPAIPSPCFVETDIDITSCPIQSTGANIGKKLPCFATTVPSEVCAPNLICQIDSRGNPSCMVRQSSLGLAGTIIAIFFAVAVAVAVFTVCFLCCRERKSQRRLMRAAEASKIAQEAKTAAMLSAKRNAASVADDVALDREPLMSSSRDLPPMPSVPGQYAGQQTGYGGGGGGGAQGNPFADEGHAMR
ncbi:hypothetical protein QBC39DRAFT_371491 [Podospora conica]|nr:hypothetical protein QBC39DRAFT_371491 [Schizothecium conicum]